jgi:competence protein ComEA
MFLLKQKNIEKILILFTALLFVFVGWMYMHGKSAVTTQEFKPLNTEMSQLLNQLEPTPSNELTAKEKPPENMSINTQSSSQMIKNQSDNQSVSNEKDMTTTPDSTNSTNSSSQKPVSSATSNQSSTKTTQNAQMMDINSATLKQLNTLPGIGDSKAQAIIDYRNAKGPFQSIEQLLQVKGIGEKLLEKIKPYVIIKPQ